jgi:hypothetical protein
VAAIAEDGRHDGHPHPARRLAPVVLAQAMTFVLRRTGAPSRRPDPVRAERLELRTALPGADHDRLDVVADLWDQGSSFRSGRPDVTVRSGWCMGTVPGASEKAGILSMAGPQ